MLKPVHFLQAESIHLDQVMFPEVKSSDSHYQFWLMDENITTSVPFVKLFRSNYSNPDSIKPPSYTTYTGATLKMTYLYFWLILVVQAAVITINKSVLSKSFVRSSWGTRLNHVLSSLFVPDCFEDWEDAGGSQVQHGKRWTKVLKELVVMVQINFFFNLALLVPMIVTGKQLLCNNFSSCFALGYEIEARHTIILPAIGAFMEEKQAMALVFWSRWVLPFILILASLADLFLMVTFMKWIHPLKEILDKEVRSQASGKPSMDVYLSGSQPRG